mmetsp:Transcript_32225/g.49974  ORF Transcript_32225/g.49974 Transcript_32225/m.49974 type:complete len:221 (-) Transcript_32225:947-1609(-)
MDSPVKSTVRRRPNRVLRYRLALALLPCPIEDKRRWNFIAMPATPELADAWDMPSSDDIFLPCLRTPPPYVTAASDLDLIGGGLLPVIIGDRLLMGGVGELVSDVGGTNLGPIPSEACNITGCWWLWAPPLLLRLLSSSSSSASDNETLVSSSSIDSSGFGNGESSDSSDIMDWALILRLARGGPMLFLPAVPRSIFRSTFLSTVSYGSPNASFHLDFEI